VTIIVNGEHRQANETLTIAELLAQLDIPLRGVAVEVNCEIVPRTRHAERRLADGDRLEIVTLVGGG
jgi:sulfur carrier protein